MSYDDRRRASSRERERGGGNSGLDINSRSHSRHHSNNNNNHHHHGGGHHSASSSSSSNNHATTHHHHHHHQDDLDDHNHHHQRYSSSSSSQYNKHATNNDMYEDERDRFAGEYVSICLKNLNDSLTDSELRDSIYTQFKKYGQFNVKIVYDKNLRDRHAERIAFVNFNTHEEAKDAKRSKIYSNFHGQPLYIEPVFVRNRSTYSNQHIPPPPPPPPSQIAESSRYHQHRHRMSTPPTPPLPSSSTRSRKRSLSPRRSRRSRSFYSSRSRSRSSKRAYSSPESVNAYNTKTRMIKHHRTPPPPPPPQSSSSHLHHVLSSRRAYHSPPPPPASPPPPPRSSNSSMDLSYTLNNMSPKYPNYRDHVKPEYDSDATRTIFIGNLDSDVDRNELKQIFDRYGYIEEIDIKRQPNKKTYAFIKYVNLDMAYNAKVDMSGKYIGKHECKIGYGKIQPTNCLWIAGFNSRSRKRGLEKALNNYAKLIEIDWSPGDQYAYALFDGISGAEDVRNNLRGQCLPDGSSYPLRIDFADPKRFETTQKPSKSRSKSKSRSRSRSRSSMTIHHASSLSTYDDHQLSFGKLSYQTKETIHSSPSNISYKRGSFDEKNGNSNDNDSNIVANKKQKLSSRIHTPPLPTHHHVLNSTTLSNEYHDSNRSISKSRSKSPQQSSLRYPHKNRSLSRDSEIKDYTTTLTTNNANTASVVAPQNATEISNKNVKKTTDLLIRDTLINNDLQFMRLSNINDINKELKSVWNGVFTLKKIAFPTKFYLLAGSKQLVDRLLPQSTSSNVNSTSSQSCLRITQRLRLDPTKVDELQKKLYDSNYDESNDIGINIDNCVFSVLISLPFDEKKSNEAEKIGDASNDYADLDNSSVNQTNGAGGQLQQRSLHNLIIYLNQKSAAGVIPLGPDDDKPIAMVHAFPPNCQFSMKLLNQLLPNLKLNTRNAIDANSSTNVLNSDYLIIVLLKN